MDLTANELSMLLSWFDSVKKHNDMWLVANEHFELRNKLKKELLGY